MQEKVSKIIADFKGIKIPASAIEKELGFANGQLGQAAKGKSRLSEDRLAKLVVYHGTKFPKIPVKTEPPKKVYDAPPIGKKIQDEPDFQKGKQTAEREVKGDNWWDQNRKKKLGLP